MIFLPSIKDMLKEAFIDPAFKELVDSFSAQKGHINLTGTFREKDQVPSRFVLREGERDPPWKRDTYVRGLGIES